MATAQYFKETSLRLWKSYQHILNGDAVASDIRRWMDLGHAALEGAQHLANTTDLSVADRQKLQAAVSLIKSVLHLMNDCQVDDAIDAFLNEIRGAGLSVPENSRAQDVESAAAAASVENGIDAEADNVVVENNRGTSASVSWDDVDAAFQNRIKTGVITNNKHLDITTFMKAARNEFISHVNQTLEEHPVVKVNTVLAAEYVIVKDDEEDVDIKYFNTKTAPIYSTTDLKEWFQEQQLAWSLRSILNLTVNINKYNPMRGSSFIDLPDFIKRKKA